MHLQKPLAVSIRHIFVNVIISFQVFNLKTSHNSSVSELPGVFEETPFHHMLEFWTEVCSTANQARDGNNYRDLQGQGTWEKNTVKANILVFQMSCTSLSIFWGFPTVAALCKSSFGELLTPSAACQQAAMSKRKFLRTKLPAIEY